MIIIFDWGLPVDARRAPYIPRELTYYFKRLASDPSRW